jgi:hypothetical protein
VSLLVFHHYCLHETFCTWVWLFPCKKQFIYLNSLIGPQFMEEWCYYFWVSVRGFGEPPRRRPSLRHIVTRKTCLDLPSSSRLPLLAPHDLRRYWGTHRWFVIRRCHLLQGTVNRMETMAFLLSAYCFHLPHIIQGESQGYKDLCFLHCLYLEVTVQLS